MTVQIRQLAICAACNFDIVNAASLVAIGNVAFLSSSTCGFCSRPAFNDPSPYRNISLNFDVAHILRRNIIA